MLNAQSDLVGGARRGVRYSDGMDDAHRATAEELRARLACTSVPPADFRAAVARVPPNDRDAWVDVLLGLSACPDDGPELPRGCVPYLPCSVDALLRLVDQACVRPSDVFVDVGSGVGRAAALVSLLTGAPAIGLEIQPALVSASRELTTRVHALPFAPIEGDAAQLAGLITTGSIFFFYCPFSGERLEKVLDDLEPIAQTRPLRICSVDLPLPRRAWLTRMSPPSSDLAIYRSTHFDASSCHT